jgi:hypothetical protein
MAALHALADALLAYPVFMIALLVAIGRWYEGSARSKSGHSAAADEEQAKGYYGLASVQRLDIVATALAGSVLKLVLIGVALFVFLGGRGD